MKQRKWTAKEKVAIVLEDLREQKEGINLWGTSNSPGFVIQMAE